jgi:diacylglycerol kinase (ATP)
VRITFIINPRDPQRVTELRQQVVRLRDAGHEVRPLLTFERGDGEQMAREAADEGMDLVIAAGGDGTLNEVANGLYGFLASGGRKAPRMGIIPLGTANDLATTLEIPEDLALATEVAVSGEEHAVDVGLVEDRCFLNVSTGGIGAEATEETSSEAKRALGALSYLVTGVRKFATLEVSSARFKCGGEAVYEGPFLLFAVGNSTRTGGGNLLTPRADMRDGLLDLCIVRETTRMDFLKLLPELRSGQHRDHPSVIYRQVPRVLIESDVELSVNADGEPLSGRCFDYRVGDHRLRLMVPRPAESRES